MGNCVLHQSKTYEQLLLIITLMGLIFANFGNFGQIREINTREKIEKHSRFSRLDLVDSWLQGIFFPRRIFTQLASRFVVTGTTNSSLSRFTKVAISSRKIV